MESKNEFIIVLPSNTPSSIKNTPADYLTTLQQPIHLEPGAWSVGLVELNFKNSIKTIHEDFIRVVKSIPEENIKNETTKIKTSTTNYFDRELCTYIPEKYSDTKSINLFSNSKGVLFKFIYDKNDSKKNYVEIQNNTDKTIVLEMFGLVSLQFGLTEDGDYYKNNNFKTEIKPKTTIKYSPIINQRVNETTRGYIISGNNIPNPPWTFKYKARQETIATVRPKSGTYTTATELISEINKGLKEFEFTFNQFINRIVLKSLGNNENITIHLENGLCDVLGFSKTSYKGNISTQQAEMELDLLRGIGSIFVYCDLCEPIRVGNVVAPLIRNVAFNSTKYGENIHTSYNYPVYLPVCKSFIDSIRITLRDARGDVVPFVEGLTTCLLQFKRL